MDVVFKVFGCILVVLVINVLSNINETLGYIAWLLGGEFDDE